MTTKVWKGFGKETKPKPKEVRIGIISKIILRYKLKIRCFLLSCFGVLLWFDPEKKSDPCGFTYFNCPTWKVLCIYLLVEFYDCR